MKSHIDSHSGRLVVLGLTVAFFGSPAVAVANTYWWNTTTTGKWGTTANWWTAPGGTTTGGPPAASDDAVFNATGVNGAATVQLGAATPVSGITFANSGSTLLESSGTASYALTTGTDGITVIPGAGAVTLGSAGNPIPITLGAAQTWTNNSSYPMTVVNKVSNGSYQLTLSGSGNMVFAGGIGNGSGGVTKSGSGMATLLASGGTTALDTQLRFTGGVNVTGGTLQIVNANSLFNNSSGTAATTISTSAGAVLELDSTINYHPNYCPMCVSTWALGTSGGLMIEGNGTLRFNGTGSGIFGLDDQALYVPVGVAMTGGTLDIAGGTLANGGFGGGNWANNKASMNVGSGAAFLMWDASTSPTIDALTGSGTIDSGPYGSGQTLTVGINNGSGAFSGVFADTNGTYGLTKTGNGVEVLSGCNTYSGTTSINQGTLKLDFSAPGAPANNIINNVSNRSGLVLSGGTLAIQGSPTASNSQQFPSLLIDSGASTITAAAGTGGTLSVSLASITRYAGATIDFVLPTNGSISGLLASGGWPCFSANFVNNVAYATVNGGSTWATLDSSGGAIGALTSYSSTNSFPNNPGGTTLITSSTSNNGGYTGVITFNHPNTTLTVSGNELVAAGGILVTPQATGTVIAGGPIFQADGEFVLVDYGSLTVASGIGGSYNGIAGASLTVSGPGTTSLSGSNTYSGTTYINGPGVTILSSTNTGAGAISISGGKLYLTGTSPTTSITVARGATLGGSGSASAAAVRVADGGILDFSQNNAGSPLTLSALTFAGGATIDVSDSAGQYTMVPALSVTTLTTYSSPVNLCVSNLPVGSGTLQILKYSGIIGGSGSNAFHLASPDSGGRCSYNLVNASGCLQLNYFYDYPYWSGAGDGNWNSTSTNNWSTASNNLPTTFLVGDTVVFDNRAGSSTPVVTIGPSNVCPASVTFSNSGEVSYTLQGACGITGSAALAVSGGGAVVISNSNGYTGGTTLSAGTLQVGNANALGSGGLAVNGGTLDVQGWNLTVASLCGAGGTILSNSPGSTPTLTVNMPCGATTYSGVLANGQGQLGLTTSGAGLLTLCGSSTYTGPTTINGGTLMIGSGGAAGALSPGSAIIDNGTLAFNLSTSAAQGAQFAASPIAGTGGLLQMGPGTLTLGASNTYSGATVIGAGTLAIGNAGAPGPGGIVNCGTLVFERSDSGATLCNSMSNYGSIIQSGSGPMILAGNISGNGWIIQNGSGPMTLAGNISGNQSITLNGGGLTLLAGSNTYTGGTSITAGTLAAGSASGTGYGALGWNSPVTLADSTGVTLNLNGFSTEIGSLTGGGQAGGKVLLGGGTLTVGGDNTSPAIFAGAISGNGGLVKIGSGTLTLGGSNSYAGPTAISGGILKLRYLALAIGIQFVGQGSSVGTLYNGVPEMTNWNSFFGATKGAQSGALKDCNGNATSAVLTSYQGGNPYVTGSSIPLLSGYLDNATFQAQETVTISGIPYGTYSVIAYFGGNHLGVPGSVQLSNATPTYYYEAEGATSTYSQSSGIQISYPMLGNYAVWNNVSGGSLTITQIHLSTSGTTGTGSGLSGVELVSPTPNSVNILPVTAPLMVAPGAALDLNGDNQQVASLGDYIAGYGGSVINSSSCAAAILTLSPNGGSTTFSGMILSGGSNNAIGLVMSGSGVQVLSGSNNTYTGGTSINGGVLEFARAGSMPASGAVTVASGAALAVSLGGPRGFTTARAGSGSIGGLISGIGGQGAGVTWDPGAILGIDTTNASGTYSGNIPNSGNAPSGLLKLGGNILTLTGSNSYTGPTIINQGTLLVNGSLASPVTVNSGGILGGSGSLTSVTVASGGSLSPGAAPAALNVSGSLSLLSGAQMDYALDTPTDSDEVYMPSGPLVLSGQQFADFNFTLMAGFGQGTYTLIDTNSVPIGSLGTSNSGTIDGMPAYIAVQGDDVVLTVVPEPSTLVMLCIGGVVLLGWRWRRITDWLAVMESPMFRSRKWLILISAFRFGGIGLILGTAVAQAETISTLGAWSNSGSIGIEYFGPPPTGTPTFGQLVMVPTDGNNMINSFAFEMNLPSTVAFRGELYAWNGNEATGPDLYESPDLTTSRSGFQLVTFNTGKLVLIPGAEYVIFATTSKDSQDTGYGTLGGFTGNVYPGFVYENNGTNTAAWTTQAWTNTSAVFGTPEQLAFTAQFSAVPEPSTSLLLAAGALSMLAYAWRRRMRLAAKVAARDRGAPATLCFPPPRPEATRRAA